MTGLGLGVAAAGVWAGYGWGAQCTLSLLARRRARAGAGEIALTFDDGPDPRATPRLLRLLAAAGARATFFLIGERAARRPDLVRVMVAEGHEVGTHTWSHRNAWFLTPRRTVEEIVGGARRLEDLIGRPVSLFRPPWGIVNLAGLLAARRHGLTTVLWSLQPEGLRARGPDAQLRYCAARLRDGDIVNLHDAPGLPGAPDRLLALMPGLLDLVRARGYRAVSLAGTSAEKQKMQGLTP